MMLLPNWKIGRSNRRRLFTQSYSRLMRTQISQSRPGMAENIAQEKLHNSLRKELCVNQTPKPNALILSNRMNIELSNWSERNLPTVKMQIRGIKKS